MKRAEDLPWDQLNDDLSVEGHVVIRGALDEALVRQLAELDQLDDDALPGALGPWRDALYQRLVPLAQRWHGAFPATWQELRAQNLAAGQRRSLSFVERLAAPAHRPLHQDAEGAHVFPIQLIGLLSEPGVEFTGGELVMTEQRPRMQSRPMVVPLARGDVALIATAGRPVRGSKGLYTVNTRHAVSRVRSGERVSLQLSFHSAPGIP